MGQVSNGPNPKGGLRRSHKWDYTQRMSETLLFIVQELKSRRSEWDRIASESGVSRRTFEKIAHGNTLNPRLATVERLAAYLRRRNAA